MSSQMVKLIVELENKAKAQLEQLTKAMTQVKQSADRATSAINKINTQAINNLERETREASTGMKQLSDSSRQTANQVSQINSNGVNQLSASSKQASTALNRASNSSRALTTTLQTTSATARNAASSVNQINGNGPRQATSTAQMLRAILVVLIGIAGQVHQILLSFANNGLDDAAMDAQKLQSSLAGVSSAGNSAKAGMNGLSTSTRMTGSSFGFLSNAASMAAGMIGYDLVSNMAMSARESINASGNFQAFGERMKMTAAEIDSFSQHCDNLQNSFRKVDMNAVGASALELGVKLKLPKESMEELTKTTAVMSSAFIKEGRTQTDAILAVSDAMDGQFRRMQELGISQEMLMNNGWDGDINNKTSLLQAMNKTLDDMGFTETAMQVNTLDEAYQMLSVSGGQLLSSILIPLTPALIQIASAVVGAIDGIKNFVGQLQAAWEGLPDWAQDAITIGILAGAVLLLMGYIGGLSGAVAILSSALAPVAAAIAGISAPMIAVVAIIGAAIYVVYELGKAFGWWEDVGTMIEAIKNNIGRLWDAFINHPDVQATIQAIQDAWEGLNEFLKPVVDWLKGIWDEIFPPDATEKFDITRAVIDAIGAAFETLKAVVSAVLIPFQLLYQVLSILWSEVLTPLAEFLMSVFIPVWNLISSVLTIVWGYINQLVTIFQAFLNGQISLSQMLGMIWQLILSTFTSILSLIISTVISWASNLISQAISAAQGFVNGVIQFIQQLPGRFYSFLVSVISYIVSAGGQWISNAQNKAKGVVDGVLSFIKQLPGKVYQEFMNIGKRILSAGSDLVNKAKQVGQDIVNGILGAMGIHSPGTIQESVVTEFENMFKRINDTGRTAYDTARKVGDKLVDGFNSKDISSSLTEATSINPEVNANSHASEQESDDGNVGMLVGSVVAEDNKLMETSFSSLTSSINMNGAAIQSRTNWITNSFANMKNSVTSALTSLENNNKSTWNDVENTSTTTLENMNHDTLNVTNAMSSAWWLMRDNIVSAAADIQSKANAHFNSLSSNIGGFYRRIQNPSSWAGPSTSGSRSSSRGAVSSGAGRLRNIVSSAITPTFAGTAPIYKLADSACKNETCKEFYLTKNNRLERFDIEEFYRRANNNFAGWGDWSPKHMSYIKKKTGEWNMKGPVINLVGGIPTGLAFKVKQFENGSKPSLGMESFQRVAEAIFGRIGYDYYWNSDKTGDPITALQTGSVNCWDGAHSLMALANVFGLSASLGRGTGHVWAVINGKTFDTTNYSLHRRWSPLPGYTGPKRTHNVKEDKAPSEEVIDLNINHSIDIKLESDGNVDVDEKTIINTLKSIITDRTLIDKIAKALKQRDRRIDRMSGA